MQDEVCECFKRIIESRKKPKVEPTVADINGKLYAGFLHLDKNDMPMVALHWEKYFQHICEKYNKIYKVQMPKVTPHVCRHTYCSHNASAGMKTDSDHVFVRQVPPYTDFNPGAVGALVRVHLQKSGIHLEGKKKGSHTLRHSLASRLLEHEIPLPVISEILGHTTTETTMTYLRIDITELRKCALEVAI